ncbi:MAG: TIGR00730 family Rossman fold protein [Planctomycetales bacterium]|nr:TIGR00730 family Rossman fold protein [Planctomycetales bacterium]
MIRPFSVAVYCSSSDRIARSYFDMARALGQAMAERGWRLVFGAGTVGLMGEVARAVHDGGGRVFGVIPHALHELEVTYEECDELLFTENMRQRKAIMEENADAFIALPGGFGTLDEALEVLTLLQTGKREMVPVVLLDEPGGSYWHDFHAYVAKHLLGGHMIAEHDFSLYKITDRVGTALDEVLTFYRVYHSQRYVRKQLVFRLNQRLTDDQLATVNAEYADVLADGAFTQREALKEEADDAEAADLPRLVFHFNRRNYGRLRQLIDALNALQAA